MQENISGVCKCGCHKAVPILIILFGLTFLLGQFGVIGPNFVGIAFPIIIILIGIKKLFGGMCTCCKGK